MWSASICFCSALGRPPEVRYHAPEGITPRLQRLLDTLEYSPAFIRTATWDVIAWNKAAAAVLTDYSTLPDGQRNVLRMMFRDSRVRAAQSNWQSVARYVVASFRADVARAGAARNVQSLVDELCATSPEFAAMWRDNDVQGHGDGLKVLHHPVAGTALDGIFGVRRRRPARPHHGDLQSRDAGRMRTRSARCSSPAETGKAQSAILADRRTVNANYEFFAHHLRTHATIRVRRRIGQRATSLLRPGRRITPAANAPYAL